MQQSRFFIITGLSGAGKSLASRCFEDFNFFCVDNLPPALLPKFAQLCKTSEIQSVALVIDIRGREFFGEFASALDALRQDGFNFEIIFLEATDQTLVTRFSETRRKHPLHSGGRILDDIKQERLLLENLKERANLIIDTSRLSPQQLKDQITRTVSPSGLVGNNLRVTIMSFGYKHGLPMDLDLLFDVRFLTNPYYVPTLRNLTGNDAPVRSYVMDQPKAHEFLAHLYSLIDFLLPEYVREGKANLTIGIGCTGGHHRSITLVNELAAHLEDSYEVVVEHRDIHR